MKRIIFTIFLLLAVVGIGQRGTLHAWNYSSSGTFHNIVYKDSTSQVQTHLSLRYSGRIHVEAAAYKQPVVSYTVYGKSAFVTSYKKSGTNSASANPHHHLAK